MTESRGTLRPWSLSIAHWSFVGHWDLVIPSPLLAVLWGLAQAVPDPPHGMDQPVRITEFFPDRGDMDVDGPVGHEDIGAHGFVHQLISGEDPASCVDQGSEELEFGECELHRFTFNGGFVLGGI